MDNVFNVTQAVLTGWDVGLSREWRAQDRTWRAEDLQWREHEREIMRTERKFMEDERAFLHAQIQQMHLDNARAIWTRFVTRNRTEVMEKMEQLKALSSLAALLAGFALVSFLEFNIDMDARYNKALLPLFGLTTSLTVGVEMAAVVLSSLMLANILRTGKAYVNEQEEAEFVHRCRIFVNQYRPGMAPPAPQRTFAAHWALRCEREWRTAFRLFSAGVPCFLLNVALAGWIKFHAASTSIAAGVVTALMGVALLYNLYTHRKWGEYLLQDEQADKDAMHYLSQPSLGLPFDWHLPPGGASQQQQQHQQEQEAYPAASHDGAPAASAWWPPGDGRAWDGGGTWPGWAGQDGGLGAEGGAGGSGASHGEERLFGAAGAVDGESGAVESAAAAAAATFGPLGGVVVDGPVHGPPRGGGVAASKY